LKNCDFPTEFKLFLSQHPEQLRNPHSPSPLVPVTLLVELNQMVIEMTLHVDPVAASRFFRGLTNNPS